MSIRPRSSRRLLRCLLLALIGGGVLGLSLGAGPASAHNTYEDSSPADGEVLTVAPPVWTIQFALPVPLESASAELVDATGVRTDLGTPRHGDTDSVVVFDLPSGISGDATARWRLVSTDGHVISGRVGFTVESGSTPSTTSPVVADPDAGAVTVIPADDSDDAGTPEAIRVLIRLAGFIALIVIGGLIVTEWLFAEGTLVAPTARRLLKPATIAVAVTPFFGLLILADDLRSTGDGFGSAMWSALSMTPGQMLLVRVLVGIALFVFLVRFRPEPDQRTILRFAALLVAYAVALAYGGHSRSQGSAWLGIPVDVVHLIGVTVWLGGLVALVAVVAPAVDVDEAMATFKRFGPIAERAVAAIVVTGVIQSLRLHGGFPSVFGSTHGFLLLVKIALLAAMLRLAAGNRRLLNSRIQRSASRPGSTRSLLVKASVTELVIGAVVLGVTAVLVGVSPS